MKKTLFIFCSVCLIITIASCGSNQEKNTNTKDSLLKVTTKSVTTISKLNNAVPTKSLPTKEKMFDCCESLVPDPNTMIEYRDANPNISYYAKDYETGISNSKNQAYSFYFTVDANFITYLNNLSTYNVQFIHFILAQDKDNKDISMYLSGIDQYGNHIYINSSKTDGYPDGTNTYWVFQNTSSDNTYFKQDTQPIATAVNSSSLDASYVNQRILATDAVNWVYNYFNKVKSKCNDVCSYVFPSSIFISYVNSAYKNKNIVAVQVILSQNPEGTMPTVIITAVDENDNQILIQDATDNQYYMLEFCTPCPICSSINDTYGFQLETIENKNDSIQNNPQRYK